MPDRETELMLRVKARDTAAFEALYMLYQKPLANYFYRLCWDSSRVDDLLQEAFLKLWRAAPGYEPKAKVSTFIFHSAHNLWINESAKKHPQAMPIGGDAPRMEPTEGLGRGEVREAVKRAIDSLPEGERECVILSEYNGFKYQEIADILDIPLGTVKRRIFTAVHRLQSLLKDHAP